MAKNAPKTTANTENNVYNQHKTTTCRITDEDENIEPEKEVFRRFDPTMKVEVFINDGTAGSGILPRAYRK